VTSSKRSLNREVFEGSDILGMRLRAAKKPAVIPFLEIPPEEIDLEPITIDPFDLIEAEPLSIAPLVVPMDEILPYDDDDEDLEINLATNAPPTLADAKKIPPEKPAVKPPSDSSSKESLSLFGVGEIETKGKTRRRPS
jgi:hypothetical protein